MGIPTYEDKVLQKSLVMLLEPIYEEDFHEFSWGFRPGKGQHGALKMLREHMSRLESCWVLDLDIKGYFDNIEHAHLRAFLDSRVKDGVVRRMIDKWLKAGILDKGVLRKSDKGAPQGGVISPLLSNVYLHEVLDEWFVQVAKPRLSGKAEMVRFADDAVLVFERERDARRVLKAVKGRMNRYGLELHPEKTRLVNFRKPNRPKGQAESKPETFDFLGFTFYWGKSRKGRSVVKMKTGKKTFRKKVKEMGEWCKENRHQKIRDQHQKLGLKLKGHYGYYGVTGNYRMVEKFYEATKRSWKYWLSRRSQRRHMPWEMFVAKLKENPLPQPWLPLSVYR